MLWNCSWKLVMRYSHPTSPILLEAGRYPLATNPKKPDVVGSFSMAGYTFQKKGSIKWNDRP
jgi:hypothetical protein